MKRSQVSTEFFVFVGIASLTLALVLGGLQLDTEKITREKQKAAAADLGRFIQSEINTAATVNDGYTRFFTLDSKIGGFDYTINNQDNMSFVINISGSQFHYIVPPFIGNFTKGINKIDKRGGIVYVNVI